MAKNEKREEFCNVANADFRNRFDILLLFYLIAW